MAEMLYRSVVQAVLLFVSETWVLLASMGITMEGTHTGFMRQITVKKVQRKSYGTWSSPKAEEVKESAGTQSETTYIG